MAGKRIEQAAMGGDVEQAIRIDRQPGAIEQRTPDLEGRGIEGERRHLQEHVVRRQLHVVGVADQPHDVAVVDHDALGGAGRTGGVDDVGRSRSIHRRARQRLGVSNGGGVRLGTFFEKQRPDAALLGNPREARPRRRIGEVEPGLTVIKSTQTARQTRLLVRLSGPVLDPSWEVTEVGLEDIVVAYMGLEASPADGQLTEIGAAQ